MTDDSGYNFLEKSCHASSMYCCSTASTTSAASKLVPQLWGVRAEWHLPMLPWWNGRQQVLTHSKGVALPFLGVWQEGMQVFHHLSMASVEGNSDFIIPINSRSFRWLHPSEVCACACCERSGRDPGWGWGNVCHNLCQDGCAWVCD